MFMNHGLYRWQHDEHVRNGPINAYGCTFQPGGTFFILNSLVVLLLLQLVTFLPGWQRQVSLLPVLHWTGLLFLVLFLTMFQYRIVGAANWTSTTSTTSTWSNFRSYCFFQLRMAVSTVCSAGKQRFHSSTKFHNFSCMPVMYLQACLLSLSAASFTSGSCNTLNWTAVSGAVSYNVQCRIGRCCKLVLPSTTNSKQFPVLSSIMNGRLLQYVQVVQARLLQPISPLLLPLLAEPDRTHKYFC